MRGGSHEERAVGVTGLGVLCPIGGNAAEVRAALLAGRHGIRPVGARVTSPRLQAHLGGLLAAPEWLARLRPRPDDPGDGDDPAVAVALPAAREAWRDAGLDRANVAPTRIALVLGTSAGGLVSRSVFEATPRGQAQRRHRLLGRSDPGVIHRAIAQALGVAGPVVTVTTACSSSTQAVLHGRDLLLAGLADAVLCGGVEALVEEVLGGFHAMAAVSPAPCAPFSLPVGMTVGEGAGFVVLERLGDAAARGGRCRGLLLGGALAADGWHPTAPLPTGACLARAMSQALADAGVRPAEVGYLNAHGSGTEANDAAEVLALERCFGPALACLPVSSTKSYFGHALGAAGVLELITTIFGLEEQCLPPTLHFVGSRGAAPPDVVATAVPRRARYDLALKASAGFGGANAALVVAAPGERRAAPIDRDEVWVIGTGAVGPFGETSFDDALRAGQPTWSELAAPSARRFAGLVPPLDLARLACGIDPRGLPTLGRYLLVAAKRALDDGELRLRGARRERTGLFVGVWRPGWDVTRTFWGSIRERGFDKPSTHAFARLVHNAPAGLVSAALGLRGPKSALAGGRGASLAALVLGREALARRRDADWLVVGSAAEVTEESLADYALDFPNEPAGRAPFEVYDLATATPVTGAGAACVLLGAGRSLGATGSVPLARLAGVGAAGPRAADRALGDALAEAGWAPAEVDAVYGSADGSVDAGARELAALAAVLGDRRGTVPLCNPAPIIGASASLDAFALVAAVEALRRGRAHPRADALGSPGRRRAPNGDGPLARVLVVADDDVTGSWAVALAAPS